MFEQIQSRLEKVLTSLKGQGKITESNIEESLRDVRRALLEADVNYKVVRTFIDRVKNKYSGSNVFNSVTPGQQFIKLLKDELTFFLGKETEQISFSKNNKTIILVAGLQGAGKTTTCVKLAKFLRDNDKKTPILIAADLQRPAAVEQLETLSKQEQLESYSYSSNSPEEVVRKGIDYADKNKFDVIIIDTAGRLHIDKDLMNEVAKISKISNPNETLYVVDSMTGQDAITSATEFNSMLDITGIILTKLDGDSRGGAALSIRECTGKPIKFIGTGESISSFNIFHPERMASRILGMGDIVSLVEKAQKSFDQDLVLSSSERLKKGIFTFEDYKNQIAQLKKLGPLSSVMSMIPGISKMKNVNIDDNEFKWIEAIINSMTKKERQNPEIINGSRRQRIASGSGRKIQDVNRLIKQFNQMKIMIKKMKNKKSMNLPFNLG